VPACRPTSTRRDVAESLIAADFRFTSPLDNDTSRDGKLSSVEVYFGWDLPHPAKVGGFVKA
jgi:hypothetical protein